MNRRSASASLLALAASLGFALAAPSASAAGTTTIGLAVANLQADFFNQIKQSVEAYGKEKGVNVITVDAKGDAATQVNQIQDLLTRKIDALIYIPAGATARVVGDELLHDFRASTDRTSPRCTSPRWSTSRILPSRSWN